MQSNNLCGGNMQGKINVLDWTGHSVIEYDTDTQETIAEAQRQFVELLTRGYVMAAFPDGPQVGVQAIAFDPTIREYVAIPRMVGG